MANQSAFTSAIGHNASEISRLHMRSSPHIEVLSSRGMLADGTSYVPSSKRQRLGLTDKIHSGDTMDHSALVQYQMEGELKMTFIYYFVMFSSFFWFILYPVLNNINLKRRVLTLFPLPEYARVYPRVYCSIVQNTIV